MSTEREFAYTRHISTAETRIILGQLLLTTSGMLKKRKRVLTYSKGKLGFYNEFLKELLPFSLRKVPSIFF